MGNTIIKVVNTRQDEECGAVQTTLTIDFTGLTEQDIKEVAAQAAVVKWQAIVRKGKVIPATAFYRVPKPGTRSSAPVTAEALIARYGSADEAIKAIMALKGDTQTEREDGLVVER